MASGSRSTIMLLRSTTSHRYGNHRSCRCTVRRRCCEHLSPSGTDLFRGFAAMRPGCHRQQQDRASPSSTSSPASSRASRRKPVASATSSATTFETDNQCRSPDSNRLNISPDRTVSWRQRDSLFHGCDQIPLDALFWQCLDVAQWMNSFKSRSVARHPIASASLSLFNCYSVVSCPRLSLRSSFAVRLRQLVTQAFLALSSASTSISIFAFTIESRGTLIRPLVLSSKSTSSPSTPIKRPRKLRCPPIGRCVFILAWLPAKRS